VRNQALQRIATLDHVTVALVDAEPIFGRQRCKTVPFFDYRERMVAIPRFLRAFKGFLNVSALCITHLTWILISILLLRDTDYVLRFFSGTGIRGDLESEWFHLLVVAETVDAPRQHERRWPAVELELFELAPFQTDFDDLSAFFEAILPLSSLPSAIDIEQKFLKPVRPQLPFDRGLCDGAFERVFTMVYDFGEF